MNCVIISNGLIENYEFFDEYIKKDDLIICADGGARHLEGLGVTPHILLGDMDSIEDPELNRISKSGSIILRYPIEKDYTDTQIAARLMTGEEKLITGQEKLITGQEKLNEQIDNKTDHITVLKLEELSNAISKVTNITLIGCTGTRLDHTFTNIYLLTYLMQHGKNAWIVDYHNIITVMDGRAPLCVNKKEGWKLSLIPLTQEVSGVTLEGFYYPLNKAILTHQNSIAVSNQFVKERASITIDSGTLAVMFSRD